MSARTLDDQEMSPDKAMRSHFGMIHQLAAPFAGRGKLIVASFGEDPAGIHPKTGKPGRPIDPRINHLAIGDLDGAVRAANDFAKDQHRNVYAPLVVMRPDLTKGAKGFEKDIVAVLGLCADFDDDLASEWANRLTMPPDTVLETSNGRFQAFYAFDPPLKPHEAKPIAAMLQKAANCDHGTKDLSHVWRVPGCRNWPNAKKVREGRSTDPQDVRIVIPWAGTFTSPSALKASLEAAILERGVDPEPEPEAKQNGTTSEPPQQPETGNVDISMLVKMLPARLKARITEPEKGDRSKNLFFVIRALAERGVPDHLIMAVIRAHPQGVGAKYVDRTDADLSAEITRVKASKPFNKKEAPKATANDVKGFDETEDGFALAFADRHKNELRYCHSTGSWFRWTEVRWEREQTKLAFSWARAICRDLNQSRDEKLAKASTAAAVERFAQSDRAFAVTAEIWDRDPFLLGTPDGVGDLRTGLIRPAAQEDFITKLTAVAPGDFLHYECPLWLKFLDEATQGDKGLIRFMQQVAGYSLTGDIREHAMFFVYGPGGNGKGVFLNVITKVLGDYATTAAMDTFTASQNDKHPTDLAKLKGARLVTASETEEGKAWAESRIKTLTGGDRISARFMRQDFFEFDPQFKLLIIGNHQPVLHNVDDAAKRRFNIVPFVHKPVEPDRQLEQKLMAEWPGILRWMIDGCLDWRKNGLVRPEVVKKATASYFSEQDMLTTWVDECCETGGRNLSDTTENLFKSWTLFSSSRGEKVGSVKSFNQRLQRQGFEPERFNDGPHRDKRGFRRVTVRATDTSAQWQNRDD